MPKKGYTKQHHAKAGRQPKLTGYRLHDKRLAWAQNGSAIRTIKYPLINQNTPAIADHVAHDYYRLFGARSLDNFLQPTQPTSILDLYITALSLGVVFAPTANGLNISWKKLYPHDATPSDEAFAMLSHDWQDILDANRWFNFVISALRPLNKVTCASAKKSVLHIAKDPRQSSPLLERYADDYATYIERAKNGQDAHFNKLERFGLAADALPAGPTYSFIINARFPTIPMTAGNKTAVATTALERICEMVTGDSDVNDILGLGSSYNGLNIFLGRFIKDCHSDRLDIHEVIDKMALITGYTDAERQDAIERLRVLVEVARQLPPKPLATKKGWENYRELIGGQLKSWCSNYKRQKVEINHQLASLLGLPDPEQEQKPPNKRKKQKTLKPEIKHVLDELATYGATGDFSHDDIEQIKDTLLLVRKMVKMAYESDFSADDIYAITGLIAGIRPALNEWWQATHPQPVETNDKKAKKNKETHINTVYPSLFKNFYTLPSIMGESGARQYQQIINFHSIYNSLIDQLTEIVTQLQTDTQPLSAKELDNIRRWALFNTDDWSQQIATDIFCLLGYKPTHQFGQNERFYISPFSRNKQLRLVTPPNEIQTKSFEVFLDKARNALCDSDTVVQDFTKALSATELCKTIVAIFLAHSTNGVFRFDPKTATQELFMSRANIDTQDISKNVFGKIIQALVFAEIRGLLSTASKNTYIERSVIRVTDYSDFRLIIDTSQCDTTMPNWSTKAKFYITATSAPRVKPTGDFYTIMKPKADMPIAEKRTAYKPNSTESLLNIGNTTRYQLQFLQWLIHKPKNKHNKLGFGKLSLVAEQKKQIVWERSKPVATKNIGEPRLFASIPFSILAPTEKNHISRVAERVLGIDVGEKGLAWVVAERHKGIEKEYRLQILGKGFLRKQEHYLLADKVKELKHKQAIGTFGSTDTYIARLRKALISNYRAEIDDIAIKYNARIAFEGSISGLETGGNRIGKIYASLKKSEVPTAKDADKQLVAHYWGKQAASKKAVNKQSIPGVAIIAAGTSQTCSKCDKWNKYSIATEQTYIVHSISAHLGEIDVAENETLMIYSDKKTLPSKILGKDVYTYTYQFMRPPVASEAIAYALQSLHDASSLDLSDDWVITNGNSAIFICPFKQCLHISDADIQAAQNIAARGFLKIDLDNAGTKQGAENREYEIENCYEQIKQQYDLQTIGFDPQLRN